MKRTFRLSDTVADPRRDVDDEIRFHLEMRARELVEQGVPPERAAAEARRRFGDVGAIEAECRGLRGGRARRKARGAWLRALAQDVAYALRSLRKSPGFTLAALLTLALGIGAAAAVFTVVDGVLLRPLPYADPARLAMVWMTGQGLRGTEREWPLSSGFYLDVREGARGLSSVAAFRSWSFVLGGEGETRPQQIAGARAAPALFATLGVRPLLGRTFTEREALPGAPRVAVLSYDLWHRRFGGDPGVLDRAVTLSGERTTIVGVMPPGFAFPRGAELPAGLSFPPRTEVWAPLVFSPADRRDYGTLNLAAVARLRRGLAPAGVQAELAALGARRLRLEGVPAGRLALYLVELDEQAAGRVRRGLLVLLAAVGLMLAVACANVANLLLARTGARRRELAIRAALGAGRGRILRQLVTENAVLSLGAALLGLGLAAAGSRLLLALVPGNLPRADDVGVDARVVAFAFGLSLVAGVGCGLVGALTIGWAGWGKRGGRESEAGTLQAASARAAGAGGIGRLGRQLLAAVEVALSLVLLIGAGLLAGSFACLQEVAPGFDPDHVLTAKLLLPAGERLDFERDGPRWAALFDRLTDRLNALPGVRAAGAVSSLPLSGAVESGPYRVDGAPRPAPGEATTTEYAVVDGDYFRAMRIRLLAGRRFDSRDRAGGAPVVVVSRELARRAFPELATAGAAAAIGRRLRTGFDFGGPGSRPREIVGVVADVKQTALADEAVPAAYVPEAQMSYPGLTLVLRTAGEPAAVLPLVERELAAVDPTLALSEVRPLADVCAESLSRQRFSMTVVGAFAASTLALALVGLYGVIALGVGQRRREIGVRMACGARGRNILALVLGEGVRLTLFGVAAGLAGAFAVTRLLASLLYGVSATDCRFFAAAAVLVAAVALLASYLPARRALRVDPTAALREE